MKRWQAWLMHSSNLLVGMTGLVYGYMRYFMKSDDPFSVVNSPWQPEAQHLHVVLAPLLVFSAGVIWQRHVLARWKSTIRSGRWSGLELMLSLAPMIASGYLLQTTTDEVWHRVWVIVHVTASLAWIAGYLTHQVKSILFSRQIRERPDPLGVMPGPDELG